LGWALTRGFDWLAWLEALNLKVDHPTIRVAARVASILALWLAIVVFSLLVVQARWGLTPGKWLCGLRTLRTTLKPCGFARSLVRETVMCVDACNFLCWTPGILSIAFTDCRQRLGDLVADTLVVEVRSLRQSSTSRGTSV
ncbi:MAG: RDD family protein, partial [Candidatus Saccharimonas sp.]|nr:RDD family protein [Planctomycetaceae bacterium]